MGLLMIVPAAAFFFPVIVIFAVFVGLPILLASSSKLEPQVSDEATPSHNGVGRRHGARAFKTR